MKYKFYYSPNCSTHLFEIDSKEVKYSINDKVLVMDNGAEIVFVIEDILYTPGVSTDANVYGDGSMSLLDFHDLKKKSKQIK